MTPEDTQTTSDPGATCTALLDALKQVRQTLQSTVTPLPPSTETAMAYNAALFHLQAAREEIKRTLKPPTPKK